MKDVLGARIPDAIAGNYIQFQIQIMIARNEIGIEDVATAVRAVLEYCENNSIDITALPKIDLENLLLKFFEIPVQQDGPYAELEDFVHKTQKRLRERQIEVVPYTYANGKPIQLNSAIHKLAELLVTDSAIKFRALTDLQVRLIQIFIRDLATTGRFTNHYDLSEELGIKESFLKSNIDSIVEKLTKGYYYIRIETTGYVRSVKPNTTLGKIIALYEANPNILNHPNLKDIHRKYLTPFLKSKDECGVYVSLGQIAAGLGVHKSNYTYQIDDALERIAGEEKIVLDKRKERVTSESYRSQIQILFGTPMKRIFLSENEVSMVNLLLEKDGELYKYSYEEIARILEIDSDNPAKTFLGRVLRLIERGTLIYENPEEKQLKRHRNVIRQLMNDTKVTACLRANLTEGEFGILIAMLKKSPNGRFKSHVDVSAQFGLSLYEIKMLMQKTFRILDSTLEQ